MKRKTKKSGIAALEFLFAAPAFFVLVFFVVEIALTWNDRHIMRLAAYRAAKSVVKTRSAIGAGGNLCWSTQGGPQDPASLRVNTAARRASAKIMATVTPSAFQLLTMFGMPKGAARQIDDAVETLTSSDFGDAASTVANNPYVHAVVRMMKGLPAAWLLTEISCQDIKFPGGPGIKETNGVEITLKYNRPAKMPYVATIMWALHWLQRFDANDDGTSGSLRINPLTFGIDVNTNFGATLTSAILVQINQKAKQIITDTATEIQKLIDEGRTHEDLLKYEYSPNSLVGPHVPSVFGNIAGTAFTDIMDKGANWRNQQLSTAQGTINLLAENAINLLLSAPDEVKTIPVQVSVRIPNFGQAYMNQGQPWSNEPVVLGSLTGNNKIARLAKALGQTISEPDPPNSSTGLPYTKTTREEEEQ